MDSIDYVALSKSRYTDQFDHDLTFDAIVQTLIDYKMRVQKLYLNFANTILDIDKSTGKNLDLIGSIVGQDRILVDYYANPFFGFEGNPKAEPFDKGMWFSLFSDSGGDSRVLDDVEYRRVIKARIIRNRTSCTRKDFVNILLLLLGYDPDSSDPIPPNLFSIESPSHGNINLTLPSGFSNDFITYFLSRTEDLDSLIPKPLGYKLNVNIGS